MSKTASRRPPEAGRQPERGRPAEQGGLVGQRRRLAGPGRLSGVGPQVGQPGVGRPGVAGSDGEDFGSAAERVWAVRSGLTELLREAEGARRRRAEAAGGVDTSACAWNHFENIPTFYNWNNRPR